MPSFGYAVYCAVTFDDALMKRYCEGLAEFVHQFLNRAGNEITYGLNPEANKRAAAAAGARWASFQELAHDDFPNKDYLEGGKNLFWLVSHAVLQMGNASSGSVIYEIFDRPYINDSGAWQPRTAIGIVVAAVSR